MTRFAYKAKDWNGKLVKGALESTGKAEVVTSIRDNGLIPIDVREEKRGTLEAMVKLVFGRVGPKQVSTFTRQLATMMVAGLPLTDALSLIKSQTDSSGMMFDIVEEALRMVRAGQPLGTALEKYVGVFGKAFIASIKAGEEGGVLEDVLEKLADNMEKENEFRGKVKGAMIYPIIVIIGMVVVAFIMMIFVIPKLMGLYKDFGNVKLPAMTVALMDISNFMVRMWFLFPVMIFGGFSFFRAGNANKDFRLKKDSLFLKAPIVGELIAKTVITNTIRTLAMLLAAGISLVEALKIVSEVAGNEKYLQAYIKIAERVQKGFPISSCFEDTGVFPPLVNQMVSTGEATGKLDEVLQKVAAVYAMEAEQSVKALTSAVEPLIMIVLGVGVGFLVVAVIMPIYNLTSAF